MSELTVILIILSIFFFPPVHRAAFSLEWGADRGESVFRWAVFLVLLLLLIFAIDNSDRNRIGSLLIVPWGIVLVCSLEIAARGLSRYLLPVLGSRYPVFQKVYTYITENPDNLYYSRYMPHPFLQFTGPRGTVEGATDDSYLGFREIKLSDRAKPADVIRVACLGGSTTADGYPEMLQDYLQRQMPERRFQVLNFGMTWWSSVHSTINYVLNVIDFRPDYLVLHDSCNDHHYRGFPGLRGDCAHAYRLFLIPQTVGESLFRFSLLYRLGRIVLTWKFPHLFRPQFEMKDIGLHPGKTFHYQEAELYVIDRNIDTICTLAKSQNSTVCLTTMPLSMERTFGEEHDRVYRPHTRDVNEIIRNKARMFECLMADFDLEMTGREEMFNDAVHSSVEGNGMKARLVGDVILSDIQMRGK